MPRNRSRSGGVSGTEWDRVFTALAAEPRRQLVFSLVDAQPRQAVSLPEAAVSPASGTDLDALRAHLVHRHLPLLADGGFVQWDREPFHARRGPRFQDVAAVIEALTGNPEPIPNHLVDACPQLQSYGSSRNDGRKER